MCGIAGIMTSGNRAPDAALLDRLSLALAHRGPDGQGRHIQGNVGFLQNRLAIIDLVTGDQPLYEPGGAALVANGEIYNYVELRQDMAARGLGNSFKTNSDFEPALHLYRRDGLGYLDQLRGMYAIALHDPVAGQLVLSRDPFGIKPLYYMELPQGLAFASEPQALIAAGLVPATLVPSARDELVQLQFTTGRETPFAGIFRLLPGETLVVADGRIVERRRRAALPAEGPVDWSEGEALERLDQALIDSVRVHQRSDVPYGMFLSGGIDSSAVLALMARLNDRPVRCFTAGFSGTAAADERQHARKLANELGAKHSEVDFSEADFHALLPAIAASVDDPTADYAILPTWKLAREARGEVKVVLSGEGGDEMFAGYGRYRSAMRPWWLGGRMARGRGMFDGLGVLREDKPNWRDGIAAVEATESLPGRSRLQIAQAVDCAHWLPNDLLTKLDRCLMAHAIEGRTPFLDPVVASVAFRLPDKLKVKGQLGKWLLRRWLQERLPSADAYTRKRGFTVPVAEWIAAAAGRLGALVAAQPGVTELCRPDRVQILFRDLASKGGKRRGFAAWTLLYYALWHQRHMLGFAPEGDITAALARR
ncbi:MAG: asparagine synthase (glutamine-hydrolyzing) [Alphaproteobacteria bacterium]|nr:asparagine synthase (glutamine-hydrolyzing) [Alphaproteobacteria bacterium]